MDRETKASVQRLKKSLPLETILSLFQTFLACHTQRAAAKALGITVPTLSEWINKHPDIRLIRDLAVAVKSKNGNFKSYVFKHLSPEAKKVWNQIEAWKDVDDWQEKLNRLLDGSPDEMKKELFVHALISTRFDASEACRLVGINRAKLQEWSKDPDFNAMLQEVHFHKQNFFELALFKLVEEGNPAAVIFANRTLNAKRGYSERLADESLLGSSPGVRLSELPLSLQAKREILEALRARNNNTETSSPISETEMFEC